MSDPDYVISATRARTRRAICTNRSFGAAYTNMQSAFSSSHEAESVLELGLENEGEEAYWYRMQEVIVRVGREAKRTLGYAAAFGGGCSGCRVCERC
jgi:hypothetical protein